MAYASDYYNYQIGALKGDCIAQVIYQTWDDESNTLIYDQLSPTHVLDKALLLHMESGIWYGFFHGAEFAQHGLDFVVNPYEATKLSRINVDFWNVSRHQNWKHLIGHKITCISPLWEQQNLYTTLYPKAIRMTFENQKSIYICLPDNHDNPSLGWYVPAQVMVIFDDAIAESLLS